MIAALPLLLLLPAAPPWSPQVNAMAPCGGQRGTEVVIVLTGQRLSDPLALLQVRPGLVATALESEKPDRCKITLKIADDCPLGAHPLRLRTKEGLSNLVLFQVGVLPEVQQDAKATAPQEIALGCTVNGTMRADATDRYLVQVPQGALVHCEVQAMRLGFGPIDLALQVNGPDGKTIAAADDTSFGMKDPLVGFRAEQAGGYLVQVKPAFADAANNGSYRLHVGTFPRPTGVLPCGGQPGEELEVTLLGDPGWDGKPMKVRLPAAGEDGSDELFRWFPSDGRGTAPTPVFLRIGGPANVPVEEKPAEGKEPAKSLVAFPGSVHGLLATEAPAAFSFAMKANEELEFRVYARALRSPLDPVLTVRQQGRVFASNDDATGLDSVQRFKAPTDGEYTVEVKDLRNLCGPEYGFRLEAARPAEPPALRMIVNQREEPVLAVPQGGRAGAVLQFTGADPDAGIELLARNLPPGVSASFGPMPRGTNQLALLLAAEAEAPPAGALLEFAAKAAKEPLERDPGYAQVVPLVMVRNNQPIFTTTMRQLPVAVTAKAPFTLELLPPAVPVVCGAFLPLRVRITRNEGFTDGVRVRALWNPPGVSAGQLTLQGPTLEGTLQVDANPNATPGTFSYAVIAHTRLQGGVVGVSSAFVPLQIDKPWITAEVGKARTEQGTPTALTVKLKPASGKTAACHVVLVGLPKGVTAQEVDAAEGSEAVTVPLTVAADAAAGRHRGFQVELRVPGGEQAVVHRFGGGEIRIDKPLAGDHGHGGEERR